MIIQKIFDNCKLFRQNLGLFLGLKQNGDRFQLKKPQKCCVLDYKKRGGSVLMLGVSIELLQEMLQVKIRLN